MDRLFVYGIFLSAGSRERFGMVGPTYDCVRGYKTIGLHGYIVEAVASDPNDQLTGLVVSIPKDKWMNLDSLEGGYDRIRVRTVGEEDVFMYVKGKRKETDVESIG